LNFAREKWGNHQQKSYGDTLVTWHFAERTPVAGRHCRAARHALRRLGFALAE